MTAASHPPGTQHATASGDRPDEPRGHMTETPNHKYNVPTAGTENWHEPLNDNFDALETDVEVRHAGPPDPGQYDPVEGAKYLDTESGTVHLGDGTAWTELGRIGSAELEGRYLDTEGFSGPAEWENDGDTDTNEASANKATVGGGGNNAARSEGTTVCGGLGNEAIELDATVGGGQANVASGYASTVPGGQDNVASRDYSLAAGRGASANHNGAIVFGDSTLNGVESESENEARFQMEIVAEEGVTEQSTRTAKTNVGPVDPKEMLRGVDSLAVSTWEYTDGDGNGKGQTHIGPMAEDFHEAFDIGDEDTISSIDRGGVAYAAIQGLSAEVEELREENNRIRAQNADLQEETRTLESRFGALEQRLTDLEA